jgi:hypothetical protein
VNTIKEVRSALRAMRGAESVLWSNGNIMPFILICAMLGEVQRDICALSSKGSCISALALEFAYMQTSICILCPLLSHGVFLIQLSRHLDTIFPTNRISFTPYMLSAGDSAEQYLLLSRLTSKRLTWKKKEGFDFHLNK